MRKTAVATRFIAAGVLLALAAAAQAQALFIARKAIGRIEQMTQSAPADKAAGASYDVATVIVDVAADKVYATALRLLGENPELRVTRSDAAKRSIDFTKGAQIGGIQVSVLGDNLAQLLISTARSGAPATGTSAIVAHVLDICQQLAVSCQPSGS